MRVLKGTKREITIALWEEQLEKYLKRLNDSMECFRRFHDENDCEHIMEDCEKLAELAKRTKDAIYFMNCNGIK